MLETSSTDSSTVPKKIVTIALLCAVYKLVYCDSEQSHDFAQKCCFGNINDILDCEDDNNSSCSNLTLVRISYDFDNTSSMRCTLYNMRRKFDRIENCLERIRSKPTRPFKGENRCEVLLFQGFNWWNCSKSVAETNFCESDKLWLCDSLFTSLNFWGANIVIFANIVYIVPYLVVVFVYLAVPGLGVRAYNRAVICYNVSQIILNGILIGIGVCVLCHVSIHSNAYIYLGLAIMFLTISSTFWLFVICIDMTLVITRFRWITSSNGNKRQERRKFLTYAAWTWGGSLLPTALACIVELSPLFSKSSPIRPNFQKFQDGANLAVILYVATFPALTCLANTILFCYTSFRMFSIQKSTTLARTNNGNATMNRVRRQYFLFIRLYLLMDAPWITSVLAAAFPNLWVLKLLRMIQPILMLLAILPPRHTSSDIRTQMKPCF